MKKTIQKAFFDLSEEEKCKIRQYACNLYNNLSEGKKYEKLHLLFILLVDENKELKWCLILLYG